MKKQNFLRVCIFLISPIVLKLKAIENFFFNFFLDFFENFWFFEKIIIFIFFFEEASKWSSWWNFEALMGFRVSKRIYLDQGMYFSNFHHCAWPLARTGNPTTYRFVVRASVDDCDQSVDDCCQCLDDYYQCVDDCYQGVDDHGARGVRRAHGARQRAQASKK